MEQLELNKIIELHREWLTTCGKKGESASLISANLRGANLRNVDLRGANLRNVDLRGANLRCANLRYANLRYANLIRANLRGADLRGANLRYANLIRANLRGADLRGANLISASLRGADLRGADLRNASLRGADLRGADLRNASLDYSAFPLWCGGLDIHIDDKQATQLLYHLIANVQYSKNTSKEIKMLFNEKPLIEQANKFHRINECNCIKYNPELAEIMVAQAPTAEHG